MKKQALLRIILRALPAMLLVASAIELIAAVGAWGAATHVEIPAWQTTFAGFAFGLPGVVIGALVLREVVRRTSSGFSLFHLQLVAGVLATLLAVGVEAALATRIADPATYDSLRDPDGSINTSPAGFLFVALFLTGFMTVYITLVSYLLAQSITPLPVTRFDRVEGERDGVGELLRGKPNERTRW